MKNFFVVALFIASITCGFAQEHEAQQGLTWHSDVAKAFSISQASNKPIFAFFTGSDWCGWCRKMQREVFAKPAFIKWATDNVVLLELDFPRNKTLPEETVQQNASLQQFFKVTGFPTIWVFKMVHDQEQKKFMISALGSLGYPAGAEAGKEEIKFLQNANAIMANAK